MNPALRPMSTGEILDRTFALYRKNFKLFVGISAIPAAFLFLARLLMLLLTTADTWAYQPGRAGVAAIIAAATTAVFGFIFYLVSIAVSQAATVFGVSDAHLEKPTSVRQCYARVKGHYWRMINLIVSVYLRVFGVLVLSYVGLFAVILVPRAFGNSYSSMVASVVLGVVVFAGFIVGIFLSIRLFAKYSLAVPACALEDIKARAAIKRSVFLSKGSIGKILAIYLLVIVLTFAVSLAFSLPLTAAVAVAKSTALRLVYTILEQLVSFAVGSVVGPLGTVALSLVYYDERVRKEAYDIQYLMEAASAGAAPVVQQPESIGATNVSA